MRATPLRLSLLAALLLHLLAVSAWQLNRSRQRPPTRLVAADDTPILLQFSRQAAIETEPLAIPLPPAMPLPLPPAAGNSPSDPQANASGRSPQPERDLPARTKTERPPKAGGIRPSTGKGRPTTTSPGRAGAAIDSPGLEPGSPARLALEKALQEASTAGSPRGEAPPATGRSEGVDAKSEAAAEGSGGRDPAPSSEPQGGAAAAGIERRGSAEELRLWNLARPAPAISSARQGLPKGLELRQLPLALARRSGVNPTHQRSLRANDGLILLWIDGPTLWLLRAPLPATRATP
jgi:hypothetical protein